ncbi:MAG: hypothetical protein SEPTF4163_006302 [Sporothrix epigloea]
MSQNIAQKANLVTPLAIYNRNRDRATALVEDIASPGKVVVADSVVTGVDSADIVCLMLSNDDEVESVTDRQDSSKGNRAHRRHLPPTSALLLWHNKASSFGVLADPGAALNWAEFLSKGVTSRETVTLRDLPFEHSSLLKIIGHTSVFNMIEQLDKGHMLAEKTGLGTIALDQSVETMIRRPMQHTRSA